MSTQQQQNKQILSAVLDTPQVNGSHEQEQEQEEQALDEEQVKVLAQQQEQSRKRFDHVLSKSSAQWRSESDISSLQNALVTVLDHIRGEASDAHRMAPSVNSNGSASNGTNHQQPQQAPVNDDDDDDDDMAVDEFTDASDGQISTGNNHINNCTSSQKSFLSRAQYIPVRLSLEERKILRLVEAALNVSEYTDVVDVLATRSKTKNRMYTQIRDLCSILTGLAVANNYQEGQKLIKNRNFYENEKFFQQSFEVIRRHKIANPEKNRDTYGKLIHLLQDSNQDEIKNLLEFTCIKPIKTVYSLLEKRDGLKLLSDYPLIEIATKEIIPDNKSRKSIQSEIQQKEKAIKQLAKKYKNYSSNLLEDDIKLCLYSISDNNSYLRCARDPCDTMIIYLHQYFKIDTPKDKLSSLSISEGIGGARLTHDHSRQFKYVYQSLALWREVCHEMFKLWYLSESDLLDSNNPYSLKNTGQGLNRVQPSPNVLTCMHEILSTVQKRVGHWVGSSVIHLGDYNVPNALVFIDKYAQVQRILGPLCTCIKRLGEIGNEDYINMNNKRSTFSRYNNNHYTLGKGVVKYINESFGGVEAARKLILRDFFRYAFDGSGASDWFSAGSCIDGRLTSAWNWCSEVEKKSYWPLMLLTGFTGFDGDF